MSKCSKKVNEIKSKLDSISGLDDDFVYKYLEIIENFVNPVVDICNQWSEISDEHRNHIFKKKSRKSFKINHEEVENTSFSLQG